MKTEYLRDMEFAYRDHFLVRSTISGLRFIFDDRMRTIYFTILASVIVLGIIGPWIAPYQYDKPQTEDGELLLNEGPSLSHPIGTTTEGYDVLSRLLYGARPTAITGILGGTMIIGIGVSIGVTAGYVGGRVDDVLMRFTDIAYSVPLIPFAIVLVAFFRVGFLTSVIVIGLLLWRGNARVLRSQVLQIKERPFIKAVRASGASDRRIVAKHILPNIASMATLFFALGVGYTIIIQAGLAFIGVSNPSVPAWGIMLRNAYSSGYMSIAWWWTLPPGILISLTVLSTFMLGREYESMTKGEESIAQFG